MDKFFQNIVRTYKEVKEEVSFQAEEWFKSLVWKMYRNPKYTIMRAINWWAPSDTWNLDITLRVKVSEMLKHLAEQKDSCPQEYYDAAAVGNEHHKWKEKLIEAAENIEAPLRVEDDASEGKYNTWPVETLERMNLEYKKFDWEAYERDRLAARKKEKKGWLFIANNIDSFWN